MLSPGAALSPKLQDQSQGMGCACQTPRPRAENALLTEPEKGPGGFRTRWTLTGIFFKSLQSNCSLEGSAFMTLVWICLPYLKHHTPGSTSPRTTYASTSSFSFKSAHLRFILSNIITYGLKLLISNTHWNINNWPTTQVTPLLGSTPSHQATFC